MKKRKNVFLCLIMALSLVCNLAVMPASAETQKEKITLSNLPAYSGEAYVELNNNLPSFKTSDLTKKAFEKYSDLDELGRCGAAYANVCKETMPTEERGAIGMIKPSGWQTVKYDNVDGKYLYNRCHLIGYQLTGENANEQNLITGTRYLNVEGMLPFENMVADYLHFYLWLLLAFTRFDIQTRRNAAFSLLCYTAFDDTNTNLCLYRTYPKCYQNRLI